MRKILGARYELSLVLIAGSVVLLIAVVLGNNMGNRVLGQITSRAAVSTTPVPIPTPSSGDSNAVEVIARRHTALSVATDPGFPDPRVTPEPPPPSTPRPSPRPSPSPTFDEDNVTPMPTEHAYTSPPLPIPIASHAPDETSPPDESATPAAVESPARPAPGRAYPSLPPTAPSPSH